MREFAYFIAGIHGIVSAVIEEIADVVLFEYLQKPQVIRGILFGIFQFVAYRAQRGRGRRLEQLQLIRIFLGHVIEFFFQHSFYAMCSSVYLCNAVLLQRRDNHARSARIDNRRRAAGLSEPAPGSYKKRPQPIR